MRFDAKCNAKASVLTSIFCCCGCKFGTNFLQREMQKHSKWQKLREKHTMFAAVFITRAHFIWVFQGVFF